MEKETFIELTMLIKDYYTIDSVTGDSECSTFRVSLNPDCSVYEGHFPEKPVSPGVCNIQMIKECAEQMTGTSLMLSNLQQCRLTTLITPTEHPSLDINISLTLKEETYQMKASIGKDGESYLEMKGELELIV